MGESKWEREAKALVERHGTLVRETEHGTIWRLTGGAHVALCDHSGDARSWRNSRAEVRRKLRGAGVALEGDEDEEDDVESKQAAGQAPGSPAAGRPVFVRRRRVVVENEVTEAVISLEGILDWLGVARPEGSSLTVEDADGTPISSPLTIRVETRPETSETNL